MLPILKISLRVIQTCKIIDLILLIMLDYIFKTALYGHIQVLNPNNPNAVIFLQSHIRQKTRYAIPKKIDSFHVYFDEFQDLFKAKLYGSYLIVVLIIAFPFPLSCVVVNVFFDVFKDHFAQCPNHCY